MITKHHKPPISEQVLKCKSNPVETTKHVPFLSVMITMLYANLLISFVHFLFLCSVIIAIITYPLAICWLWTYHVKRKL